MDQSLKGIKSNEFENESLIFDDNYDEEQFMKQANQNQKIQKLSIMDDFNELCTKLNHLSEPTATASTQQENTLAQYYAKLKLKNDDQYIKIDVSKEEPQKNTPKQNFNEKNNRHIPIQAQHIRSASESMPKNQSNPLQISKHQRNPSQGEAFKKKIIQEMQINDSKRNYSSVEDKKKLLQPTKNTINHQQNLSMKDYYGDEKNIISKKQLNKKMMSKELKTPKDSMQSTMNVSAKETNNQGHNQRVNKENKLKESNLLNTTKRNDTFETQKESKVTEKEFDKDQRPRIILYKKKIDLSLDPEDIKALYRLEVMRSDYEMSNLSMSSIDQGLFGNAIQKQRNTKTAQNVQSPSYKFLQPTGKQQGNNNSKQYLSSPINIGHSPNPTNMQKSIFQRYR